MLSAQFISIPINASTSHQLWLLPSQSQSPDSLVVLHLLDAIDTAQTIDYGTTMSFNAPVHRNTSKTDSVAPAPNLNP